MPNEVTYTQEELDAASLPHKVWIVRQGSTVTECDVERLSDQGEMFVTYENSILHARMTVKLRLEDQCKSWWRSPDQLAEQLLRIVGSCSSYGKYIAGQASTIVESNPI